jgi:hypothetical protein
MLFKIKSFNQFHNIDKPISEEILNEELNEYQKNKVDEMPNTLYPVKKVHDAVFGAGNDRVIVPYDDSKDEPISTNNYENELDYRSAARNVIRHLAHHGYSTDDYHSGLVSHKDKPTRKIKITKALDLTGTGDLQSGKLSGGKSPKPLTWKQLYATDELREAGKGEKQLVFSRHRYDVAGVSTDRGWSSCMAMPKVAVPITETERGGINHRFLKNDLEQGTIAAYITRKGDDEAKRPIGRISLKRFSSGNHDIYRAEGKKYGTFPKGARAAVSAWGEEKYPSNPGLYVKHPSLYDDDGKTIKMEKASQLGAGDRKTVGDHFRNLLTDANNSGLDRAREAAEKGDYNAYDDHDSNMHELADKLFDSLPRHETAHHAIRLLIDHASDHDGDSNWDEGSIDDRKADHYLHKWALNQGHGTSGFKYHVDELKNMKPDELFDYHKQIDSTIHNTNNPENHEILKEYHNAIIDHIMKHGSDQHKNAVLHDMMPENYDTKAYYEDMMSSNHSVFDTKHPALLTTNPRTIHTMMDDPDKINHFPVSSWKDSDVAHHVGEHTDEKLANHIMHGQLQHHFDYGKPYTHGNAVHEDFVKGLNDNPHGEHIQHVLTSQMVLSGGHNPDQQTTFDTNPIHTYTKRTLIEPTEKTAGKIILNKSSGTTSNPLPNDHVMADAVDSADEVDKFAMIGQHSKFKSVVDKLRNRHDTQIPAIQNAIKDNEHGLHESTRLISLRQFLREALDVDKPKEKNVKKDEKLKFNVDPDIVTEPEEKHLLSKDTSV